MDKDKLQKAYEAVEMLRALDLPVSKEQLDTIYNLEENYLKEEVIPFIKGELNPLVKDMMGDFHLEVSYSKNDGLNVHYLSNFRTQENSRGRRKATETTHISEKHITKEVQYDALKSVLGTKKKQATLLKVYRGSRKISRNNLTN